MKVDGCKILQVFYRVILALALLGAVYVAYQYSQKGRYERFGSRMIIDTHTGKLLPIKY